MGVQVCTATNHISTSCCRLSPATCIFKNTILYLNRIPKCVHIFWPISKLYIQLVTVGNHDLYPGYEVRGILRKVGFSRQIARRKPPISGANRQLQLA